tara:strand:- start:2764 stop:3150 length:387 start_codon:yes stop_codon:yes gene_type:complete
MEVSKSTIYGFAIMFLIIAGGIFMVKGDSPVGASGNVVAGAGQVQEVVVGMKNYNYFPNTVKVKAGSPVRMRLDDSVYGCFRDLTIRDFGVRKYLRTADDYVEFTPTKTGNYKFACSMGMGYGTLIVE